MALQALAKRVQALIEACRIVPKRCVPHIGHHLHLCVRHCRLVLIDDGRFDNRIGGTMRN